MNPGIFFAFFGGQAVMTVSLLATGYVAYKLGIRDGNVSRETGKVRNANRD